MPWKKSIDFICTEIGCLKTDMTSVKSTYENNVQRLSVRVANQQGWEMPVEVEPKTPRCPWKHAWKHQKQLLIFAVPLSKSVMQISRKSSTSFIVLVTVMMSRKDRGQPSFVSLTDLCRTWCGGRQKTAVFSENNLCFTEDLTAADKALRKKLWPLIDAAKKEGKKAHFAGTHVIIEGKEVRPTSALLEA